MNRILVTGSSGRIGAALIDCLLADGQAITGLDREPSTRQHPRYREIVGALDDTAAVTEAMAGVDSVVHLGAFMSWNPADVPAMFDSNVDGTRILLQASVDAAARRFVFASSGEVYPENRPDYLPITESHPLKPTSPYGLTKLLGEEMVRFHQRSGRIETVILRFSHTQNAAELLDETSFFSGPRFFLRPRIRQQEGFGNHEVAALLKQADPGVDTHILARNERGRPVAMHITDTRDMVDGILLAMQHPDAAGGTFNLGATDPVDFATLLPAMASLTGLPLVTVDLPGDGVFYHTSNALIRETLGFEPRWTIEQMLDEAAAARAARRP